MPNKRTLMLPDDLWSALKETGNVSAYARHALRQRLERYERALDILRTHFSDDEIAWAAEAVSSVNPMTLDALGDRYATLLRADGSDGPVPTEERAKIAEIIRRDEPLARALSVVADERTVPASRHVDLSRYATNTQ